MQKLLSAFQDDTGATSMMRVVVFLVIVAVVASKFYNSHITHTPITWDASDMETIGLVLTGKIVQNFQESTPTPPKV